MRRTVSEKVLSWSLFCECGHPSSACLTALGTLSPSFILMKQERHCFLLSLPCWIFSVPRATSQETVP